ncbi:DEAD/DEAH box helicase [Pontibacter sp. G13]|uniref:DEAD/DEAH box helicase n=1 Tax=Pontibacter sp. G13 TaxID=3074898 RepID=UPI00288A886D|nr:DEAD/DEAH box helicase [Pontibacter sp. G13]WNJ19301.1 DEAD/DEAH box helicase [Pontibacter sp. G13]
MRFEDYRISPGIKQAIGKLGWKRPTDIQFKAIPHVLKGEDVLAIAQTGTGKTAAFAIPVLHMLDLKKQRHRPDGIKCVVMEPTRELAIQITRVFEQIGKHTGVKTFCVFGGVEQGPQIEKLEKGIDILVATPGRLFDLTAQGHIRLDRVEILILDEADHMLDLGFYDDIQQLIRKLPRNRQTLFFSATIDEKIKKLAYSLTKKPIRISLSPKDPVSKNVDHAVAHIEMDDKRFFLEKLAKEYKDDKILVFVRTQVRAERVIKAMERVGIEAVALHGGKEQKLRLESLRKFKQNEIKMMVATDVSARGIDIPNVQYVINYDLPDVAENYVHRVGRTGRGTARGKAISFASDREHELLQKIEEYVSYKISVMEVDKNTYQHVVETSEENESDWKSLIKEHNDYLADPKKRKKKKRGKKK